MRSLTVRLLVLVCLIASAGFAGSDAKRGAQHDANDALAEGGQWGNKGGKGLC